MKPLLTHSVISLMVATALWSSSSLAESALTGYSSDNTIPYSLFDETESTKPWVKPSQPVKKPLRPATASNVQQQQKLQQLEESLGEQQRLHKKVLSGHQSELQALHRQLQELEKDKSTLETQRQKLTVMQQELAESQSRDSNSQEQLSELQVQLAAHQLMVDTQALQQSTLSGKLKEQEVLAEMLRKQLAALNAENQKIKDQAEQPDGQQQAELKRQQNKIAELETTLNEAEKQQASMKEILTKQQALQQSAVPESHEQKLSYANGVAFASNIVQSLRAQQNLGVAPDRPMVLAGIKDAFSQRVALNSDEVATLVKELDGTLNEKLQEQQKTQSTEREKQLKAGNVFIEKTKQRKGVKVLDGTYYVVSKVGKGEKLTKDSTADILLTGRLADGTVFDNSGKENRVQRVKLNSLLPALTNVLSQMKKGSEMQVILPADKAFGDAGVENMIPPGATLIFDIKING